MKTYLVTASRHDSSPVTFGGPSLSNSAFVVQKPSPEEALKAFLNEYLPIPSIELAPVEAESFEAWTLDNRDLEIPRAGTQNFLLRLALRQKVLGRPIEIVETDIVLLPTSTPENLAENTELYFLVGGETSLGNSSLSQLTEIFIHENPSQLVPLRCHESPTYR